MNFCAGVKVECCRDFVSKIRMDALPVVKGFDVVKEDYVGLGMTCELIVPNLFSLDRADDRFDPLLCMEIFS